MHEDLAAAKEAYAARPTDDYGHILPTEAVGSSHLERKAFRSSGISNPNGDSGLPQKEKEDSRQLDGGNRLQMHKDLAKEREAYEMRPRDDQGRVILTGAIVSSHLERKSALPAPVSTADRPVHSVSAAIHDTGMTQKELEDEKWFDRGSRKQVKFSFLFVPSCPFFMLTNAFPYRCIKILQKNEKYTRLGQRTKAAR